MSSHWIQIQNQCSKWCHERLSPSVHEKNCYADDLHILAKNYPGSEDLEVNTSCSIQILFRKVQVAFKVEILLKWKTNYIKVSVLGVIALGGHFATLCQKLGFY